MQKGIKTLLTIAVTAFAFSGCTSVNPYTGQQQVSNTTAGAGIGAVGGALIGGLVGGGRGAAIGAAAGGIGGAVVGSSMDREQAELGARLRGTGVQVRKVGNSVKLIMQSDVTFAFNSANINRKFYPVLNSVSDVLRKYDNTNVLISGYTDNTGNPTYNQRLSEARARSVLRILADDGVSRNRLFARGFGERHPIARGHCCKRSLSRGLLGEIRAPSSCS